MNKNKLLIICFASLIPIIQPLSFLTSFNPRLNSNNAVLANEKDYDFYYDRAIKYLDNEEYYRAIQDFDKGIQINPNDPSIYIDRGVAKEGEKDLKGAICNVSYFSNVLTTREISTYYNLLFFKNPPVNNII